MTKKKLADYIRCRAIQSIWATDDDETIFTFLRCRGCGEVHIDPAIVEEMIAEAKNLDDFYETYKAVDAEVHEQEKRERLMAAPQSKYLN